MDAEHRSPLRMLAPAAVVVFGLVLLVVIASTGGSSKNSGGGKASTKLEQQDLRPGSSGRRTRNGLPRNVYIVKRNDTFGSIAGKTGVPVDRLQELNPDVDPQTLHEGQKIKLR